MDDAPTAAVPKLTAGQTLFHGRYVLERKLGQGGMGVVWLARDTSLTRSVALKFLPEMMLRDPAALDDLREETRRSLELTHPNIVRIYDFEEDESAAGIAMELVDGGTLASLRLQKPQKMMEPGDLLPWLKPLCEALHYAHTEPRIVHRDLKPANLMVTSRGQLKVADFGIARSITDSVSRASMTLHTSGTPVYMSPQQFMGRPSTASDDIYSVGATLYDLLTGKPPFYTGNIIAQVQDAVPPSIEERRRELDKKGAPIPPIWEEVIAACLSKDPAERPPTALALHEWLIGGKRPEPSATEALSAQVTAISMPQAKANPAPAPPPTTRPTAPLLTPAPPPARIPEPTPAANGSGWVALIGLLSVIIFAVLALAGGGYFFYTHWPTAQAERDDEPGPAANDYRAPAEPVPPRPESAPETPVAPVAPAPPPAPTTGALVVNTIPSGAAVYVDGERAGVTPLTRSDLSPGAHRLRLEAVGHEPQELAAVITAGQVKEIGPVSLTRKTAAPAPAPAAPSAPAPGAPAAEGSRSLLAESARRKLSRSELGGLSKDQLWRLRNEIYARYGLIFSTDRGRAFARTLGPGYRGIDPDQDRVFRRMTPVEQYNVELIKSLE